MQFVHEHPVITLWALWIVTVPLGPLVGWLARKYSTTLSSLTRRLLFGVAALSISIALLAIFTHWSLRGFWADAVNLAFSYVAVWMFCSLPYQNARWIAENGRVLAGLPSALLAVLVYTALPFFAFTDGLIPDSTVDVKPELVARISQFGWETMNTDVVELVWHPRWFPMIEHSVHKWVNSDVTCAMGKVQVYAESTNNSVVSTCLTNPDLYDRAFVQ